MKCDRCGKQMVLKFIKPETEPYVIRFIEDSDVYILMHITLFRKLF